MGMVRMALACLVVSACVGCRGNSVHPLVTVEENVTDSRIEGEWVGYSRKDQSYDAWRYRIRSVGENIYECECFDLSRHDEIPRTRTKFRLTLLGPFSYVDVFQVYPRGLARSDEEYEQINRHFGHLIFAVHIEDNRICFGAVDLDRIRQAMKKGVTLPAHEGLNSGQFRFTASTAEVRAFLSKHGSEIITCQDTELRRPRVVDKSS